MVQISNASGSSTCNACRVTIEGEIVGEIGNGLVVLLGIARDDTKEDADYLVPKIIALRIFDDAKVG